MAADVTSIVLDCVHGAKSRALLRKRTSTMNVFPAFEPQKSVAINIPEPQFKSRCGFQYTIVTVARFSRLVLVVPLRRIRSVDVAGAFL